MCNQLFRLTWFEECSTSSKHGKCPICYHLSLNHLTFLKWVVKCLIGWLAGPLFWYYVELGNWSDLTRLTWSDRPDLTGQIRFLNAVGIVSIKQSMDPNSMNHLCLLLTPFFIGRKEGGGEGKIIGVNLRRRFRCMLFQCLLNFLQVRQGLHQLWVKLPRRCFCFVRPCHRFRLVHTD